MPEHQDVILVRIFCRKHGERTWHILIKDTEFKCLECQLAVIEAVTRALNIPTGQ